MKNKNISTVRKEDDAPKYKRLFALFAASVFAGIGMIGGAAPALAIWEDENVEEQEDPEGIELYDTSVETIGNASGDYISMQSIASPDLFTNIGDGTFPVEWDVYISPASDVSANDPIEVFLGYDTSFDVDFTVQRCEHEYVVPPNTDGSSSSGGGCGGESENWEEEEVFATNYVDGVRGRTQIGDFNLQNGAYLRITATPGEGSQLGDTLDLEIIAQSRGLGELVAIGNTSGTGRTQAISSDAGNVDDNYDQDEVNDSDENNGEDGTAGEEEVVEEGETTEPDESAEPEEGSVEEEGEAEEDSSSENDVFSREVEEDTSESEEPIAEEEAIPYDLLIGGGIALAVVIGGIVFVVIRKRNARYDDDDDEYLDDEDDEEDSEEDYQYERRSSQSF